MYTHCPPPTNDAQSHTLERRRGTCARDNPSGRRYLRCKCCHPLFGIGSTHQVWGYESVSSDRKLQKRKIICVLEHKLGIVVALLGQFYFVSASLNYSEGAPRQHTRDDFGILYRGYFLGGVSYVFSLRILNSGTISTPKTDVFWKKYKQPLISPPSLGLEFFIADFFVNLR